MRALWSDRPNCSHNVSQKVKRIRCLSEQKTSDKKKGFHRGWCTNCQNLREQQNVYHPQDCTGDVHHGFCGGGARIMGFD